MVNQKSQKKIMTTENKILACHGHVNYPSIARMTGVSLIKVHNVMRKHDKEIVKETQVSK
jgi:hypothetical protein